MRNFRDIFSEFRSRPLSYWFGLQRARVSFELTDGRLIQRCGDTITELARVSEIQSWGFPGTDSQTVPIRVADRTMTVLDQHGTLRRILEQVAGDRRGI